jgi:UDP-3-O-[3-hydroxymyristoyl] glucosamine N-acyltransferase
MMRTLGEVATALGLECRGDPELSLRGLSALAKATSDQLSFVTDKRYLDTLAETQAGALILKPEWADRWDGACLFAEAPYLAFAHASQLFDNRPVATRNVHATAVVDASAQLGANVTIGPHAVIEAGARIGDGAVIDAGAYVGANSVVGAGSRLHPGCGALPRRHAGRALRGACQYRYRIRWLRLCAFARWVAENCSAGRCPDWQPL